MGKRPLSERKIQVVSAVKTKENETRQKRKLRVAAYCRVSTDSKEQETSFDSQVAYYSTLIANNPDWDYVGIYADPAISGTSRKNRAEFNRMLYDCIRGKIEISLPKWIQSHKSETALKPLEIRHFTAFAPSSAALGEGRFSVLCG